jgi:3-hydroxypropanoate dehydrogenase
MMQGTPLENRALDQLFRAARSRNGWSDRPVPCAMVREIYELLRLGPTSANSGPGRFVFVRSSAGKEKLAACAFENNRAKILKAPVTAIIAYDLNFAVTLPRLFPARGAALEPLFKKPELAQLTAMRNGSMQGAYLILAARSLGLDCGPMSGFDNAAVDAAFFPDTTLKSNFLCSFGYGTDENLFPRNPRLAFEEACSFA